MVFLDSASKLWQCISDIARDENLSVYDIELKSDHCLCVVISKPKAPDGCCSDDACSDDANDSKVTGIVKNTTDKQGVSSDDCARLCRRLMIYFRAEGEQLELGDEPEIEVCSPGINRMLRLANHFVDAVGERIKVVRHKNVIGDMRGGLLEGLLKSVDDVGIKLLDEQDGDLIDLRFNDIKRAYVDYVF